MYFNPQYVAFISIFALGLLSPGPDFVLVTHNALLHSSSSGRWSALGVSLGTVVHVFYCLVGIGLIIQQSILLYTIIKFAGALYLIYLGVKSLFYYHQPPFAIKESQKQSPLSSLAALRMGFMTNALNPKATVIFVALFSQVIKPHTPFMTRLLYGIQIPVMTFVWFLIVATLFSVIGKTKAAQWFLGSIHKITGIALILFGIELAFAHFR